MKIIAPLICASLLIGGTVLVVLQPQPHSDADPVAHEPLILPLVKPKIVVIKSKRRLRLYSNNKLVRTYRVGLGFNPVDDKVKEGDGTTPESDFYI
ncbi:MAG: hypothetical protein H7Z75_07075, partial [Ferruginibacter sp.]|nr:hypothetical protein [Cytophagales bacterium]